MSSRLACWLNGHDWEEWDRRTWRNLLGVEFKVRFCRRCNAQDSRPA